MKKILNRLRAIISETPGRLLKIDRQEYESRPPGKWSKKEILGHLLDSASNNHQRFVCISLSETTMSLPGYAQDDWVAAHNYQQASWPELVEFWVAYNRHLLRVLSHVPEKSWEHWARIGDNDPVTLRFLAEDYVRHMEHHLEQILGPGHVE